MQPEINSVRARRKIPTPKGKYRNYREAQTSGKKLHDNLYGYNSFLQRERNSVKNLNHPVKNFDEIFNEIHERFDKVSRTRANRPNNFFDPDEDLRTSRNLFEEEAQMAQRRSSMI